MRCFGINMPKSRDIQAKMPSPKVILIAFLLVTVKVLNSYFYATIQQVVSHEVFCNLKYKSCVHHVQTGMSVFHQTTSRSFHLPDLSQ